VKSNEIISKVISEDLYLTYKEKNQKKRITELIDDAKIKIEDLKERQAELDLFCFDHFVKLTNKVDLKKEELKVEIYNIAEELIDRLKECKLTHEKSLKLISLENVLTMDEVLKLENDLVQDSRKVDHIKETYENLETKMDLFDMSLNQKMEGVARVKKEIDECSIDLNPSRLESTISGSILLNDSKEIANTDIDSDSNLTKLESVWNLNNQN